MNDPDIDQTIREVQAGSVEAYQRVVEEYHRRLRLWLSAFCPPAVEPDEVANRAFLQAYRQIARYRLGTDFFAWLCAFARNLALTECEKIQRRARNQQNYLELCLVEQQAHDAKGANPVTEVRSRFLAECLELLKREARELIDWRYGEGLRVDAIAKRLGRSASAVSVQLFGLRKVLRDCVAGKMRLDKPTSATGTPHGSH
jgi:RNA polymerase sigma-70 factor (ECF subfamily)